MSRQWSWRAIHREYDSLRSRYYNDCHIPKAGDLTWSWTAPNVPWLGVAHLDEDDDPFHIDLHPMLRKAGKFLQYILLHEMSHMKLGRGVSCQYPSKLWAEETRRLANLGAFWL